MPLLFLFCLLGFWSWLTIIVYKLHLKHKEVYYKHKEEIKKQKEADAEAAKIKWVDVSFDLINVDSKTAQKILKIEDKNGYEDVEHRHYFDYSLEPYGDNKLKVVIDDEMILGDIQEKDIEEAKNIGYIKKVMISKKLDNEGKYVYYATAMTIKKE